MPRGREPRALHRPDTSPVSRRFALLLVSGGLVALATGVGLSVMLTYGLVFVALLGGLAYALGVSGLAENRWVALPAFVLGLVAPFLLTFGVHSVLMQRIGHTERCVVAETDEHPSAKYPSVDYVLTCRSGEVELDRDWDDRLAVREAEVLVGPPLRPVWADDARWNLLPVTGVPVAMTLLVPVAWLIRKQP